MTFTVQRQAPGRLGTVAGKRRCVAQTRQNATAPTCTRPVSLGSFTQAGVARANTIRFSGRLAAKTLPASTFTLLATPARGQTAKTSFKIKR